MYILIAIVHLLIALGLILIVLLQGGKGADIGAAFGGGSSQTVFGGRGAATFLSKLTSAFAVLFMVTSIALTLLASHRGTASVISEEPPARSAPAGAPATPATSTPVTPAPSAPAPAGAPSK